MNRSGRVDGRLSLVERPGADLVLARREKGNEPEQSVRVPDQTVPSRLPDPESRHELLLVFRRKLGDIHFHTPVHAHETKAVLFDDRPERIAAHNRFGRLRLVEVENDEFRFERQQRETAQRSPFLRAQGDFPQGFFLHELPLKPLEQRHLDLFGGQQLLLGFQTGDPVIHDAEIPIDQLHLDDLPVPGGIDAVLRVGDIRIVERPDDMHERVGFGDERKKRVAEPGSLAGVSAQPRQVHELHGRGCFLFGLENGNQMIEPGIRNGHHGPVRVGLSTGVGFDLRPGPRNQIEHGALPAQRQSDDATFQHAVLLLLRKVCSLIRMHYNRFHSHGGTSVN